MKSQAIPKFPSPFIAQVRTACKHYHNDSRLSKLPLASLAVQAMLVDAQRATDGYDVAGRAEALRHVIERCLHSLKPQAPISREGEIYLCLYCHIHKRDPYTGQSISDLLSYLETHPQLPMPPATYYYRLKKEGFPRLCYLLSSDLAQQTTWREVAKQRGHVGLAAAHYHHALRLLATKEATLEAWLHRDLAWVLAEQNDIEEAWDEAQRARIALENTLGIIARRRGKLDLALQHLEQGARIAEEYGEQRTLTRLRNNMALIYLAKKQYQTAISLYQQNLTLIHEIGELVGQAITLMNLGYCYGELGASEEALHHLNQALPIFESLGDSKGLLLVHTNLAEQQLQLNQLDSALKHAQIAISYPKSLVPTTAHAYALRIYADILLAQDQKRAALTAALNAYDALRTSQTPDQFSDPHYAKLICQTLARIYKACDEPEQAENYKLLAETLGENG